MQSPELSIIIVSWNVWEHLAACLNALPAAAEGVSYEVIVIDNASEDETVHRLQQEFPHVRLWVNDHNLWYTAAANQGLAMAKGRMAMLLNPDVLPHPGSIAKLVQYANTHPEAGLLGPRMMHSSGKDDLRTGREFPTPWSELVEWSGIVHWFPHSRLLKHYRLGYDRTRTSAVPLLSGACLLFSAYLPPTLRQLNPAFVMYSEDIDLCRRVWQAGLQCVLVAEAKMTHIGGASSRQRPVVTAYLAIISMNRYFLEWEGERIARRHRLLIGFIAFFKALIFCLTRLMGYQTHGRCQIHRQLLSWAFFHHEDSLAQMENLFASTMSLSPHGFSPNQSL